MVLLWLVLSKYNQTQVDVLALKIQERQQQPLPVVQQGAVVSIAAAAAAAGGNDGIWMPCM